MSLKTLSRETQNAIALVTDPYHDTEIETVGFPDDATAYSILNRFNLRYTIQCPFTLADGDSWDFHVFALPLVCESEMALRLVSGSSLQLRDASTTLSSLNVTYHHYRAGALLAHSTRALPIMDAVSSSKPGRRRIVSHAYEIHDTTASLYRSGSLTTYRTSSPPISISLYDSATTTDYGVANQTLNFWRVAEHPASLITAEMLPGTVTWDAGQGVYAVSLPEANNTFASEYHQNVIIGYAPNPAFDQGVYASIKTSRVATSPLRCCGTMSSQFITRENTFNLDFRLVLETVPHPQDINALSYCRRSADHNPQFLKLYKAMLNHIPIAVPVNQNSAGDWFRKIAGIVREVLPMVPSILPPMARPIAMAALPLADNLLSRIQKSEPTKNDLSQRFLSKKQTKRPINAPTPRRPKLTRSQRNALVASATKLYNNGSKARRKPVGR